MKPTRAAPLPVRCERAGTQHAAGLIQLLEASGSGCFCNYWHFDGDKNAWLEQCFVRPEGNRQALELRLAGEELCGVVALQPEVAVGAERLIGWMKVTRAVDLPRLYEQRVYRNLPCFQISSGPRDHVYAIGCLYIEETSRRRGVARQLLEAGIQAARQAGGSALEAFPRALSGAEKLREDELLMGPEPLFLEAGFRAVSDFRPYPVLRLPLLARRGGEHADEHADSSAD